MHNPFAHHRYMFPEQHMHIHYTASSGVMPFGAHAILLLIVLFWLGVLVYYLLGRLYASRSSDRRQTASTPYYQPSSPPPFMNAQQRSYQQGYRPVQAPRVSAAPQETAHYWQEYEEPQALYPEMPPLQS